MQYVKGTNQELLTTSPQFPALVIAHQGFDKARLHWHEGFEVVYVRRCRATVMKGTQRPTLSGHSDERHPTFDASCR